MSAPDISAEDLARVEAMIREDIEKAVRVGPGWSPAGGAVYVDGQWTDVDTAHEYPPCGVCAIGSVCVMRQPEPDGYQDDVATAARVLSVPMAWCVDLYYAVMHADGGQDDASDQIWSLSRRLRAYGNELTAAKAAPAPAVPR